MERTSRLIASNNWIADVFTIWRVVFLTAIVAAASLESALAAGWDCQRGKDNQEWSCKSSSKATKPAEPSPTTGAPAQNAPTPVVEESAHVPPAPKPKIVERTPTPEPELDTESEPAPGLTKPTITTRKLGPEPIAPALEKQAAAPKRNKRGWDCQPSHASKGWDCQHAGPEPEELASLSSAPTTSVAPSDAIFRGNEAGHWADLLNQFPENPWIRSCQGLPPLLPSAGAPLTPEIRAPSPTDIFSDYAQVEDEEIATFKGKVDIKRGNENLRADHVTHNTTSNVLNARGNVLYSNPQLALASDSAFMKLGSDQGLLRNTEFILPQIPSRGTASVAHLDSKTRSRYEGVTYTACPPGNRDWVLRAKTIKLDREAGRGAATNARVSFKGVPFFYFPYLTFPIDSRRESGFLSPAFGYTQTKGFETAIPYYWNIAPNYDATIIPRYLSRRGLLFGTEFRYLTESSQGRASFELLPEDQVTSTTRGRGQIQNSSVLFDNVTATLDANYISDRDYYREIGNSLLAFSNNQARHVYSQANVGYAGKYLSVTAKADNWQTIDPLIPQQSRPYRRLPQVRLNYQRELFANGPRLGGTAEVVSFDRTNTLTAERFDVEPRVSWPLLSDSAYVTPSVAVKHSQYWLHDDPATGRKSNISRTVPTFSTDAGLFFDRDIEINKTQLVHTLEPRLFYVYIPHVNQRDIPLFDSAAYDFNFYQLFRENRYAGVDRIGDTNQLTVALTSRLIESDRGWERMRATFGNIFYFSDRKVGLTPSFDDLGNPLAEDAPVRDRHSNLIANLYTALSDHWSINTGVQWNPNTPSLDRTQAALRYRDEKNRLFNLGYRFRRSSLTQANPNINPNLLTNTAQTVDQSDVSFRLPVAEGWNAVGRWQYSFANSVTLESFLGFERETCCWRFRLIGRRYINDINITNNSVANTGVFMQIEFKSLSSLGDDVDSFLQRSLSGYRRPDDY